MRCGDRGAVVEQSVITRGRGYHGEAHPSLRVLISNLSWRKKKITCHNLYWPWLFSLKSRNSAEGTVPSPLTVVHLTIVSLKAIKFLYWLAQYTFTLIFWMQHCVAEMAQLWNILCEQISINVIQLLKLFWTFLSFSQMSFKHSRTVC